jgi:hypothetical protein
MSTDTTRSQSEGEATRNATASNYTETLAAMDVEPRVPLARLDDEVLGEDLSLRSMAMRLTNAVANTGRDPGNHTVTDAALQMLEQLCDGLFADVEPPGDVPTFDDAFDPADLYLGLLRHRCLEGFEPTDTKAVNRVVAVVLEELCYAISTWVAEVEAAREAEASSEVYKALAKAGHDGSLDRETAHAIVDSAFDDLDSREEGE